MARIRRVGFLSLGALCALLTAVFVGVVLGAIAWAGMLRALAGSTRDALSLAGWVGGVVLGGAVAGFVLGLFAALLFNLLARVTGGLYVDLS